MFFNVFFIVVLIIGVVFVGVSYLLGVFYKSRRTKKYIPSGIAGAAFLAFLIKAFYFSTGFEGLGYIIFAVISAMLFIVSFITALIMEYVNRSR